MARAEAKALCLTWIKLCAATVHTQYTHAYTRDFFYYQQTSALEHFSGPTVWWQSYYGTLTRT